ncbi:MAG: DUF6471 domain-containing protein [Alphaproteobacteria bacterium]|nr:DUF6471 domain-containing protein [Alphaproteobacteria bacterium]
MTGVKGYIVTCDDFLGDTSLPVKIARRKSAVPLNAFKERAATVEFEERAKVLLKKALAEKGLTHGALVAALTGLGLPEIKEQAMTNKISRGGFSAAFLLQCMDAMGLELAAKPKR